MPSSKKQKLDLSIDEQLDRLADDIYEKVSNQTGIDITHLSHDQKKFIVKIKQNDILYIKNNYHIIDSKNMMICFMLATVFSTEIEIIDFLIESFNIDVYKTIPTILGHENCFSFICSFSANIRIIKHLIDKYNVMNDGILKECLYRACGYAKSCCNYESNLDVIKYLVEEKNTNVNIKGGKYCDEDNYFLGHAWGNIEATIYLMRHIKNISDSELENTFRCYGPTNIKQIMTELKNDYKIINHLLRINNYLRFVIISGVPRGCQNINDIKINPLMIDSSNRDKYNIFDPFLEPWDEYVKLVDGLIGVVPIISVDIPENKSQCPDFSKCPDKLFQCNDIIYYGDRAIMYDSLVFLQDIHQNCNFDDLIILNGRLPKYIVNHYINASYTGKFVLNNINPLDLSVFIKFIDQYPTAIISIEKLERQIIKFFDDNKLNCTYFDDLKDIFIRYRLKYLYLHMHNLLCIK